jgi:hypothetical protein
MCAWQQLQAPSEEQNSKIEFILFNDAESSSAHIASE